MNRALALAALLAATAGCAVGPEYHRPEVPLPQANRYADVDDKVPEASLGDLAWWEAFRDPALQGLIREAQAGNSDLKIAASRVAQASAFARVTGADLWPQLGASAGASYGRSSRELSPGAVAGDSWSVGLGLSWELDLWGRVRSARDAALAELRASEAVRQGTQVSLVAAVAQAYLELRTLDLELEITRASTEARRGSYEYFANRARGGLGNDLEVNQARADYASAQAGLPSTERAIALKEHQLCLLLGRPPGPIARGATLLGTPMPPQLPAGLPASLLSRRPDVRAAEERAVAAVAQVRVAAASRLPSLSLNGSLALDALSPGSLFGADALAASVGAGLFAPLFQGGRLVAAQDAARANAEAAAEAWRQAVLGALRDVADAAVSKKTLAEVRKAQEVQVASTREAERLARLRLEGGVSSYLEVLDAQRQSYSAEISLARTQRDEILSVVQLYRALGGGWKEETPADRPAAAPPQAP